MNTLSDVLGEVTNLPGSKGHFVPYLRSGSKPGTSTCAGNSLETQIRPMEFETGGGPSPPGVLLLLRFETHVQGIGRADEKVLRQKCPASLKCPIRSVWVP